MPNPTIIRVIAEETSEFAKCLVVFFVLPPTITLAAYALHLLVR